MSSLEPAKKESAIVRAVEAAESRRLVRRPWHRHNLTWAFGGALIGAAAMAAVQPLIGTPKVAEAPEVVTSGTASQPLALTDYELDLSKFSALKPPKADAVPDTVAEPPTPRAEPQNQPQPEKQIRGELRQMPAGLSSMANVPTFDIKPVSLSPEQIGVQAVADAQVKSKTQQLIESAAKKAGGSLQTGGDGQSWTATVPTAAVAAFVSEVAGYGLTATPGKQTTTTASVSPELRDQAQARVDELTKKRADLLVSFYEDAIPVKHVDEELANAREELEKLTSGKAPGTRSVTQVRIKNGP